MPDLPQLVLDWVDALEADGSEDDAMAACREGLERVEAGGSADEVRAQIADRLAVLGGRRAWRKSRWTPAAQRGGLTRPSAGSSSSWPRQTRSA